MEIIIYTKNKRTDGDYAAAISEYAKRLSPYCKLRLMQYKTSDKKLFGRGMHTKYYTVTAGKDTMSSEEFSELIKVLSVNGFSTMVFFICSSEKDVTSLKKNLEISDNKGALDNICLTSFSLDEGLTASALAEQLYRAYTILNNITYHK